MLMATPHYKRYQIALVAGISLALAAATVNAQESETEAAVEEAAEEAIKSSVDSTIEHIEVQEAEELSEEIAVDVPKRNPGMSRSDYQDTVPASGGQKSVGAELINADIQQVPLWEIDFENRFLTGLHDRKQKFNSRTGIAFSVDYSFLTQHASHSISDKDSASDVFRIYGNWLAVGSKDSANGNLVFKYEHRAAIWGRQTPRDLGFDTGSALSTANYKENGWGWTDLYWKQVLKGGKMIVLAGHMDPGDWADQHALLNAWTHLLNDAFYNNPAEAIPKRTLSIVSRVALNERWYSGFGVHDANGKDNHIDFGQVWDTPELFTWLEVGQLDRDSSTFGETTHLHYWHQDKREAAGVGESWGLTASRSRTHDNGYTTVFRIGYSEGDAAQMRRFVGFMMSKNIRVSDRILAGIGWGSPPDKSLGSQTVLEAMYRLQLTDSVVVSPDLQVTFNPSFASTESVVYVIGMRFRMTF